MQDEAENTPAYTDMAVLLFVKSLHTCRTASCTGVPAMPRIRYPGKRRSMLLDANSRNPSSSIRCPTKLVSRGPYLSRNTPNKKLAPRAPKEPAGKQWGWGAQEVL
jgi:hypothetical protein